MTRRRRPRAPAWTSSHVLVTGGSSGIGRAFVREVGGRGARVSVLALPDGDLQSVDAELRAAGTPVFTTGVDVADAAAVGAAVQAAERSLGPVQALLTSAGIAHPGYFTALDDTVFRRTMDVDYFGTLHALRAVVPGMVERGAGSVVGISSAAGLVGVFGYTAYGPAKFAVRGLLEALRCELRPHGIHVACVCPPDTDTPQLAYENRFKPDETRAISGRIAPMPPERVASSIVRAMELGTFLVTPGWQTWLLARTAGPAAAWYAASFDRRVHAVLEARRGRRSGNTGHQDDDQQPGQRQRPDVDDQLGPHRRRSG